MLINIILLKHNILQQQTQILIIPVVGVEEEVGYLEGEHGDWDFVEVVDQGDC